MTDSSRDFGFRYRFNGRNYALTVEAASEAEAKARVAAMASAEFLTELKEQQPSVIRPPQETVVG